MTQKPWNKVAIAATATLTLLLAGCGTNPYGVDQYGNPIDPYGNNGYGYEDPYGGGSYGGGSDYGSDYGSGGGSYGGGSYGGGYGSDYGSGTGSYGSGMPVYTGGELSSKVLNKKQEGIIFFKKLVATVQIKNPTTGILTGEITVHFTKNGKVVDTQTEFVSDLGPGQTHTFEKKSRKSADNAEVSVVTKVPSNVGGTYGSGMGTGTGYGTGSGSGYDTGYGTGGSTYPGTGGGYPSTGGGYGGY